MFDTLSFGAVNVHVGRQKENLLSKAADLYRETSAARLTNESHLSSKNALWAYRLNQLSPRRVWQIHGLTRPRRVSADKAARDTNCKMPLNLQYWDGRTHTPKGALIRTQSTHWVDAGCAKGRVKVRYCSDSSE